MQISNKTVPRVLSISGVKSEFPRFPRFYVDFTDPFLPNEGIPIRLQYPTVLYSTKIMKKRAGHTFTGLFLKSVVF
jgi:hypothetical protein